MLRNEFGDQHLAAVLSEACAQGLLDSAVQPVKLLVAGSNASAMDQLWALYNHPGLNASLRDGSLQLLMVSSGVTPYPGTVLQPRPG